MLVDAGILKKMVSLPLVKDEFHLKTHPLDILKKFY
jgi:hypothetical protein